MRNLYIILIALVVSATFIVGIDSCQHHNDYKVAANDLTIIGSNLVGDILAVTANNDTVLVYGKYSSLLYSADTTWQTVHNYFEPVGFTVDSVIVKPY